MTTLLTLIPRTFKVFRHTSLKLIIGIILTGSGMTYAQQNQTTSPLASTTPPSSQTAQRLGKQPDALSKGRSLAQSGKFGQAIPFLNHAVQQAELAFSVAKKQRTNPQDLLTTLQQCYVTSRDLGAAYVLNGEPKLGIIQLNKALKAKPKDPSTLQLRATAYTNLGKWRRANRDLDNYLLQRPNSDTAWVNKGSVMERREKYAEAGASYEKALVINPNSLPAQFGLATLLARQARYQEALPILAAMVQQDPNNKAYQLNKALALYHTESLTAAVESFTKVLTLDKGNTQALTLRGVCYYRLRNAYAACRDWTKSASLGDDEATEALKKYCNNRAVMGY